MTQFYRLGRLCLRNKSAVKNEYDSIMQIWFENGDTVLMECDSEFVVDLLRNYPGIEERITLNKVKVVWVGKPSDSTWPCLFVSDVDGRTVAFRWSEISDLVKKS